MLKLFDTLFISEYLRKFIETLIISPNKRKSFKIIKELENSLTII
jgi:hypothetical protein